MNSILIGFQSKQTAHGIPCLQFFEKLCPFDCKLVPKAHAQAQRFAQMQYFRAQLVLVQDLVELEAEDDAPQQGQRLLPVTINNVLA